MANFVLQLLHTADQEAGIPALLDAPRFSAVLNALKTQDADGNGVVDYENTIVLSSGDAYIPGPFLNASGPAYGGTGRADILIQNELGFQAIAFGNHEFDLGTSLISGLLQPNGTYPGALFPYLSGNLDFSTDSSLAPLVTADGQEASTIAGKIAASTVVTINGERIGVVGATTPTLRTISSPGGVGIFPVPFGGVPTSAELDALAAVIQQDVDALLAQNPDIDKVIVLAHMQQIAIEQALATRLRNVDIIVAGGSNTRLLDETDRLRAGDTLQGQYPYFTTDAAGNPIAVVNTDGNYKYVGRLVIEFDENGNIIPGSYDPTVSGAYATDAQGVAALNAESLVDPEIQAIVDRLSAVIAAQDGAIFGKTDVFLNGTRSDVRTQETNLGNLTADANLDYARDYDPNVVISIKNGGGVRDNIGFVTFPPGSTNPADALRLPPGANPLAGKEEGDISQLDITNALRFNNSLSILSLTATELLAIVEHGVAASGEQGRFPQIGGMSFSFDPDSPAGDRVSSIVVQLSNGQYDVVVANGEVVGDPSRTFRVVTLGFLADGGDGYPFPTGAATQRLNLDTSTTTGDATFAADGTEQDALAEYLLDNFSSQPFSREDVGRELDTRIQNLNFRNDTVLTDAGIFLGDDLANQLLGNAADNVLLANGGDDTVAGGLGDDTLYGGDGNDILRGDNNASYSARQGGDDLIYGGAGDDRIGGKGGNDTLYGEDGNDAIWGDQGDDLISGGLGNDTLRGGDGRDTFVLAAGEGTDLISDFRIGVDRIALEGLTVASLTIGSQGRNTTTISAGNEVLAVLQNVRSTAVLANVDAIFA